MGENAIKVGLGGGGTGEDPVNLRNLPRWNEETRKIVPEDPEKPAEWAALFRQARSLAVFLGQATRTSSSLFLSRLPFGFTKLTERPFG